MVTYLAKRLFEKKFLFYENKKNIFTDDIYGNFFTNLFFDKKFEYKIVSQNAEKYPIPVNKIFGIKKPNSLSEFMDEAVLAASVTNIEKLPFIFAAFGKENKEGKISPVVFDFTDVRFLLVSGMQGYGKTKGALSIILSILWGNSNSALSVMVLDLKGEDMYCLRRICDYTNEEKAIGHKIDKLINRIKVMKKFLAQTEFNNINEYNLWAVENGKRPYKYQICLIEEFGNLFDGVVFLEKEKSKDEKKIFLGSKRQEFQKKIKYIAAVGRSAGVFLILSTQRACRESIDSTIKANMSGIMSFKQLNKINENIAGIEGASNLYRVGNALLRVGTKNKNILIPRFSSKQANFAIKNLERYGKIFGRDESYREELRKLKEK